MFLKRIELSGFKSFADKTELEFVPGVTAVVGPNGSGKSNISDGIRWVLGEQSARSLRGGKMEDIIFAGSDSRKAVNYSEVSLTLDNTSQTLPMDYHEVSVTRRLHRSGESEYFINKQPCRLKDITELFMDTGIGKEAYSIIGQGRIEEILSTRSEDRRGIFEEASGIVKYKARKKEAEKKLGDTEQNLLRIHDLVSELEDQLNPLKEQSDKALEYKRLKEELRMNEVAVYVHQIEQLHAAWTESGGQLEQLKGQHGQLSAVVNLHDAQLEQHRWTTRQLEEELETLQASLLQISEQLEKNEGAAEVLKERKRNYDSRLEELRSAGESIRSKLGEKKNEIEAYTQKRNNRTAELNQLQQELDEEEARLLGMGGNPAEAEEKLKSELLDTLNKLAQVRNEARYAQQQEESVHRRKERLQNDHGRWLEQQQHNRSQQEERSAALAVLQLEMETIRESYLELAGRMKDEQTLLAEAELAVRKWEQRIDAMTSRKETMKELQNDYDGFLHGVREVLKTRSRKDGLRGIHGAVAELVRVPQEFETAMETALGGALQNIVVEDEAAGREVIAFLKKRQLGRATVLPMDVIKGRSVAGGDRGTAAGCSGFMGIAADLVQFDEKYRKIVESLLGNVMVADKLENANRIAARCQYRYRVVTVEGDVVNPGGSMTGGSLQKKNANLLGRQRQIEEIEQDIAAAAGQLKELTSKAVQLKKNVSEQSERMEQLRQDGERKRLEELKLQSSIEQGLAEAKQLDAQLQLYNQDLAVLVEEWKELQAKQSQAQAEARSLEGEEARLQEEIQLAEKTRKASESVKAEVQTQLTALKVKAAGAAQDKQSIEEQLRRFAAERDGILADLRDNERLTGQLQEELQKLDLEAVGLQEQVNDLKIRKQQCVETIEFKRAERSDWLKKLEAEENKTREQRLELKRLDEQLVQLEVKVNRLDVELDNMLRKLAEEYELSFELAKQRYPVPEDISGAQQKVKEIKREIAQLGEVNIGAIEEYQRVSERHQFLSGQKQDLMDAKAALYEVIREMNEEMSRRFMSTFLAIRSHFVTVFSKLFGGGRADLILTESDNPLETGIEIVAQPPGKKLQNLQLLSGGERALTALGLLFAILHVKPVPFCVLDEVEAALDEANVTRFAEYLREFSAQTQFIVVTHRKGTMEEADVLYGVTMEEGGVSKLVSVRLEDMEQAVSA